MSKPKVVILAGGSNSRFFPLNTKIHKGAIELLGEPLINRTLNNLAQNGFKDIIIIQSARDKKSGSLEEVVGRTNLDLNIKFLTQTEAKGMGNATLLAKEEISDQFALISNYHFNAGDLINKMLEVGSDTCICASQTKQPWLYGILELENSRIIGIKEKPKKGTEKSNLKIMACYLLNQSFISILQNLPESEYNFEEALNILAKESNVRTLIIEEEIKSLKFPWQLFKFQKVLFAKNKSATSSTAQIAPTAIIDNSQGPVIIEEGVKIGDFAKVVGPCYIGKNCLIGDYSFIRSSSLEENSIVGAKTEVVRSIIMNNSSIHFGYLADSIVGPNNKIGAGLITANKRLDRKNIKTMVKGIKTDTGISSFGIVSGDGTQIGISTSTMPGVMLGANAQIYPGQTLSKNIDHNSIVQKS